MSEHDDIVSRRPFLNWGFAFEIGRSNGLEDTFVMGHFENKKTDRQRIVVDIGAADGLTGSNSRRLILDKGWSAILVEPFLPFYNYLLELYEGTDRVKILNYACDTEEREADLFFTGKQESAGLTSLLCNWENSQKIKTNLFSNLITEKDIDFLSLDTEGKDLAILQSIDFSVYNIEIICVEKGDSIYNSQTFHLLSSKGYQHCLTTDHNFIFVKK